MTTEILEFTLREKHACVSVGNEHQIAMSVLPLCDVTLFTIHKHVSSLKIPVYSVICSFCNGDWIPVHTSIARAMR